MTAVSAHALSFKANMQALRLPVTIGLSLPPDQADAAPGEMTVGLQRMCGDGDVANLAKNNPEIQFVPQSLNRLDIIAGYWIVDGAEDASPLPTTNSFMPVAYIPGQAVADQPGSIQIADTFLPINHSVSSGKNGLEILAAEVVNTYKNASRSFGSSKSFRLYSGVFTCLDVDDNAALVSSKSSSFKFMPSPTELTNQINHGSGIPKSAYDAMKSLSESDYKSDGMPDVVGYKFGSPKGSLLYSQVDTGGVFAPLKVFFDKNPSKLKNQDGADNVQDDDITSLSSTTAFSKAKQILDLDKPNLSEAPIADTRPLESAPQAEKDAFNATHPTDADKLTYMNSMIQQWKNALPVVTSAMDLDAKFSFCESMGLNSNRAKASYKWEVFPMNVSCKKLFNETDQINTNDTSLFDAYNALTTPVSNASQMANLLNNFWNAKRQLAMRFYVANALNVFQKNLQGDKNLVISHANCFNKGSQPLITRLVGSYPLHYKLTASSYSTAPNPFNHLHPEPGFAISDWKNYAASDVLSIWGQVTSRTPVYPPGAFSGISGISGFKPGKDGDYAGGSDDYVAPPSIDLPDPIPPEPLNTLDWGVYLPLDKPETLPNYKVDGNTFKGPAINILFKIRSIGGSCPAFC